MNPSVRALAAAVALAIVAVAYFAYQARMDRPGPPRPAPSPSATHSTALPAAPATAREILGQRVPLDLRGDQVVRLEALDRLWMREASGLTAMIREAERAFSVFAGEAQAARKVSLPELQRRSEKFSELSAELRERRLHHSEAALRVLDDWQRQRVTPSRPPVAEGRSHEAAGN